jgi:hypothetical protein
MVCHTCIMAWFCVAAHGADTVRGIIADALSSQPPSPPPDKNDYEVPAGPIVLIKTQVGAGHTMDSVGCACMSMGVPVLLLAYLAHCVHTPTHHLTLVCTPLCRCTLTQPQQWTRSGSRWPLL